jgi:predicted cobalt transporter CbtA
VLRTLLICGLLAGLCGGLLGTGFAKVVGEPPLDRAVAWESARAAARGEGPHTEVVSRTVQSSIGLAFAACVYGVSLGALFALVFAGVYGRISRAGPGRTALGLAAAAFVVLYLMPFVKYPPNPPAIGDPATIGDRTALYFGMVAISVLAAIAAVRVRVQLVARLGGDAATLCGVGAFVGVVAAAGLVMPDVNEVPRTFPATTLWDFRVASLGVQLVMWTTIGLVFAAAAGRAIERSRPRPARAAARAR